MSLKGIPAPGQVIKGRINAHDLLVISAYGIAVKNGFKGTEEEWLESLKMSSAELEQAVNKYLEENPVSIDATLSIAGQGADAKATGEAIAEAKKIANDHVIRTDNPHGVTAAQVGARPNTWTPTASEVGARPSDWMPTAQDVGARPNTWMPTASDVGARPNTWMPTASDVGAVTASEVTQIVNDALGVIENGSY